MREVAIRTLQDGGRISIPSKTLEKLGWKWGDDIKVFEDVENGQVIIRKGG